MDLEVWKKSCETSKIAGVLPSQASVRVSTQFVTNEICKVKEVKEAF